MNKLLTHGLLLSFTLLLAACNGGEPNIIVRSLDNSEQESVSLSASLERAIGNASGGQDSRWLLLPDSDDLPAIPQDANNPLSRHKITLGKMLFHDTALAVGGVSTQGKSWSCATCHHAAAGFKAGVPQGIGEGGTGFGVDGSQRTLHTAFDANAADGQSDKPDLQPLASPTVLNSAYQPVMLWNGQFGASASDAINTGLPPSVLSTPDTPKKENARGLSGLETQAIAGMDVHRLELDIPALIDNNVVYRNLFTSMGANLDADANAEAGKAIAAFERTVLANKAPFQLWLRGDTQAMSNAELRGGVLFFDKAGCTACHRGPALSSEPTASENDLFMAIGFDDFDTEADGQLHGLVKAADKLGRGGFTQRPEDAYKFKIPQLYNLADTQVYGHGASFRNLRAVLEYKNNAQAQNSAAAAHLDSRFVPLELSDAELDDLEAFISNALRDPDLDRYQPDSVPSGECVVVDPGTLDSHGFCP